MEMRRHPQRAREIDDDGERRGMCRNEVFDKVRKSGEWYTQVERFASDEIRDSFSISAKWKAKCMSTDS